MQPMQVGYPMERIATDILEEFLVTGKGNRYILVVSDYFYKWSEAIPMPNMEAKTVAKLVVEEVICRFGFPVSIHSDQSRQYESLLQTFANPKNKNHAIPSSVRWYGRKAQ